MNSYESVCVLGGGGAAGGAHNGTSLEMPNTWN